MSPISDRPKPASEGSPRLEGRAFESFDGRQETSYKRLTKDETQLIILANSKKKLFLVLQQYGIRLTRINHSDEWSDNLICPFPFHKGGKENTPSFGYNYQKDRFHCFGCTSSGRTVEFLAFKEDLDKVIVAQQILRELGGYETALDESIEDQNPKIKQLLFDFSKFLQIILQNYKYDTNALNQVDKVIWWFDNYIVANAPKDQITVEELSYRIMRATDLLKKFA